jgi:hypothetical protein
MSIESVLNTLLDIVGAIVIFLFITCVLTVPAALLTLLFAGCYKVFFSFLPYFYSDPLIGASAIFFLLAIVGLWSCIVMEFLKTR